ncbi:MULTISPECIES: phage holin family protein [Alkalihalophilus]|uniref:Membrane protein n=1 Tax=Alkalihalophilus marmarensis DSM 21297 TaxID=1188261 RepID=U6SL37_9BACI|nr:MULTISPECIES: phage holin family protein [Alkalihalophilus]ERN52107.1 membrane protein [Alkalihalophilus marmarensis DSM 21297]MEC2071228.1 phage holin family protein [Alkalihalophilus marmarensis]WEG16527.1 phage holin family protein [Alkalihalophilus pseudofirmus]
MRWIIGLVINAVILLLIAYVFDGFELAGFWAAIVASVLLSIVNAIVKPVLVVLTLPITILTLGLFLFVVSALTLMLTAALMGDAFVINGFGMALLASILIALIQTFVVKPLRN